MPASALAPWGVGGAGEGGGAAREGFEGFARTHKDGLLKLLSGDALQGDVDALQASRGGGGRHDAQAQRGDEEARALEGLLGQAARLDGAFNALPLEEEELANEARGEARGKQGRVQCHAPLPRMRTCYM